MRTEPEYPTKEHERASKAVVRYLSRLPDVEAVIMYGSCSRGKATKDSCLDFSVLVPPRILSYKKKDLEKKWNEFYGTEETFKRLLNVGKYSHVDLEFFDGHFTPGAHHWTSGPDDFELNIGNSLVYGAPLFERGEHLRRLKSKWLPYYGEGLRTNRLAMVEKFFLNNLDHIPLFVKRGLYFQSFDRLYHAFGEFLQALFISRRIYPIAYDKWIKEQIVEILGLPELYARLASLLEIKPFESDETERKAEELRRLFEEYLRE